ncbi:MAG: porin [Candidatus Thiodiazotropha sp. DIVDIV]
MVKSIIQKSTLAVAASAVMSIPAIANDTQAKSSDDIFKAFGQVNVSIDNSSENGPGAEEGTSFKSNSSRLGMMGSMKTYLEGTKLIYKAAIQYESVGENDQNFLFRDALVGLKNKKLGAVRLGRLTTGYKSSYTKIDPWTDHILQARQSGQQGASNLNANYFNNAIDYTSPKMAGFQVSAFYSMLPDDSSERLHNAGKLKDYKGGSATGIGIKYFLEGLRLTADVLDVDADDTGSLTNGAAQKIGAQYKFKNGLTLAGHYEDVTELKLGTNIWAHASYKVGKHGLVTASYGINEGDPSDNVYTSDTKGDATTWSIGGKYMLTKNSALIVGYNDHDRDGGDDAQTFTVGIDAKFGY